MATSSSDVINFNSAVSQCCDDVEFLKELLNDVMTEWPDTLADLQAGVRENDNEKIRFHAHKCKGTAVNLSLTSIAKVAEATEKLAKEHKASGQPWNPTAHIQQLSTEYSRLRGFMVERGWLQ
eukprot:GILJ01007235.1.p1 GENE.GILJ01007235.1~~GILJ01007235.1.p1  ORF type:complete len:123 (-),score=7.70 GILJ01007235.1:144-512(-)